SPSGRANSNGLPLSDNLGDGKMWPRMVWAWPPRAQTGGKQLSICNCFICSPFGVAYHAQIQAIRAAQILQTSLENSEKFGDLARASGRCEHGCPPRFSPHCIFRRIVPIPFYS